MHALSSIGATRPFSQSDRAATEAPAAVSHNPEQSAGAIGNPPPFDWISDPLAQALLASLQARPPMQVECKVESLSSLYGKKDQAHYVDGRVKALGDIRREYGDRCLDWSDANYPAQKGAMVAWCNLPDEHILTAIVCRHAYYDPTGAYTAFKNAWRAERGLAA